MAINDSSGSEKLRSQRHSYLSLSIANKASTDDAASFTTNFAAVIMLFFDPPSLLTNRRAIKFSIAASLKLARP